MTLVVLESQCMPKCLLWYFLVFAIGFWLAGAIKYTHCFSSDDWKMVDEEATHYIICIIVFQYLIECLIILILEGLLDSEGFLYLSRG